METTDYVSYPIALALKKAGFEWKCHYGYSVKLRLEPEPSFGELKMIHSKAPKNYNDNRKGIEKGLEFCSAVPLWQVQKWLREKWDWHIDVFPAADCSLDADGQVCEEWNYWDFDIMHVISTRKIVESEERYDSFEQALSAGIAAALELIEQKGA